MRGADDTRPALIVVHGIRGSGKTTLAHKLSSDLALPVLGKDDVKEFLLDKLGYENIDKSRLLGSMATDALTAWAERFVASGYSLIIESAFGPEFVRPKLQKLAESGTVNMLELYCVADADTRIERYVERTKTGTRHPGHFDADRHEELRDDEKSEKYAPLGVCELLEVNTTNFGSLEYSGLLEQLRTWIQKEIS